MYLRGGWGGDQGGNQRGEKKNEKRNLEVYDHFLSCSQETTPTRPMTLQQKRNPKHKKGKARAEKKETTPWGIKFIKNLEGARRRWVETKTKEIVNPPDGKQNKPPTGGMGGGKRGG